MGKGGIENLLQQQQADASPFNAEFRIGGLYDSRVGSSSGGADKATDTALAASLVAGWQAPLPGDVGLRLDYSGYADFHKDFNQYNVIDQSLSLEPQYRHGPFIYSLPFAVGFIRENGGDDYNRYSVFPTLTYLFPNSRQAVALYGIAARIDDRDNDRARNEDGKTLGGGCAYVYAFENRSRVRLSLDYQHTTYEARVVEYGTASLSTDKRADNAVVAGLDFLFPLTDHLGLYMNYAFMHSNSNVDLFEYDRHVVQGGVALRF
ncbi:MAG: hypothetical protein ACYC7J_20420 [Syntrophales bacterium]